MLCVYDDVTYVYDDVTYVYDDVTYVYDDVTYVYDDVPKPQTQKCYARDQICAKQNCLNPRS